MAVSVNVDELKDKKESNPETKFIPAGNRLARFVSYIELGIHKQMFKGAPAKYESGKNAGREKPPCLHVALTFEFPTCEYTGDYPLTIATTRRMENGDFFGAVTVPPALADGTISRDLAMKTKFMKYLSRIQEATGKPYPSLADFAKAQVPLLINVTNKKVTKDGETKTYANMKPEGIMSPRIEDPVSGEVKDYTDSVPPTKGEYCKVFDWDNPTEEAWKSLKPWDKKTIKAALNFEGSPIQALLTKNPELDQLENAEDGSTTDATSNLPPEPPAGSTPMQGDIPV